MKQDVYQRTLKPSFEDLKEVLQEITVDLEQAVILHDKRLLVTYTDKGAFRLRLKARVADM
jgi:hypothetical protein